MCLILGHRHGALIYQSRIPIAAGDTFASLYRKVTPLAVPMLNALIATAAAEDRLPPAMEQDHSKATLFHAPTERELHGTLQERAIRKVGRSVRRVVPPAREDRDQP
ncbi:MAG: hypothetical protein U0838_04055 [Chloroflexota bacterium]